MKNHVKNAWMQKKEEKHVWWQSGQIQIHPKNATCNRLKKYFIEEILLWKESITRHNKLLINLIYNKLIKSDNETIKSREFIYSIEQTHYTQNQYYPEVNRRLK